MSSLLVIGSVWPEPDSSAAGRRMMQLLSLFQSWNYKITFACSAAETDHMFNLENLDIECQCISINSSTFDTFVSSLQPDVVLFDRFIIEEQFGWRVGEACPDALRILDTEDLHSLRRCRKQAVKQGNNFHEEELLSSDVAKREIASIYRCDVSLMISEFEIDLLERLFKVDSGLIHYMPFLLEPLGEGDISQRPSFVKRRHFVMIGNFRHPPNWDAVTHLKTDIWPLIRRELPNAEVHIYGAYPTQKVWDIHDPAGGFYIEGRAEDAEAVIEQGRVSLAPLRFGAGLKGKLVESMICGTPSITTPIGAEGLADGMEWCGSIVNESEAFASAAVELYKDRNAWKQAQDRGAHILNDRFAKPSFDDDLKSRISEIKSNLTHHRKRNFTGGMLMHHTMASTRYMSKWIEEKNSR